MPEFIYVMSRARKAHGDKVILDNVTMSFYPGAKIGVVGPNGAGKSSILKIMAGIDQPSNGEARLTPGYSVGILMQEPVLNEEKTVLGNVEEGAGEIKAKLDRFNAISAEMAEPDADFDALMTEMGKLQEEIDHADAWDLDSQLEQAMDALRCPAPDADISVLSGGEKRRVALCQLLLRQPDLLLLDEPTNHLDILAIETLEDELKAARFAVLMVSHDRTFLERTTKRCFWLENRRVRTLDKGFKAFDAWAAKVTEEEAESLRRLTKEIERETYTFYRSITAQRTRNEGRARRLEALRQDRAARVADLPREIQLGVDAGQSSGKLVAELKGVAKSFSSPSHGEGDP